MKMLRRHTTVGFFGLAILIVSMSGLGVAQANDSAKAPSQAQAGSTATAAKSGKATSPRTNTAGAAWS
jgi:hypothetical protein